MILIDNTVLSNFALTGELTLLEYFCGGVGTTTGDVLNEFERGEKDGIFICSNLDWLNRLDLKDRHERVMFANLCKKMGVGDASCLAVAINRRYDLLSDDMTIRTIALREGIRVSGSIGVILELIRIDKISLEIGNKILGTFIKHGYFSPVDSLDELL